MTVAVYDAISPVSIDAGVIILYSATPVINMYKAMLTYAKECENNYLITLMGAYPIRT